MEKGIGHASGGITRLLPVSEPRARNTRVELILLDDLEAVLQEIVDSIGPVSTLLVQPMGQATVEGGVFAPDGRRSARPVMLVVAVGGTT